MTGLHSISAARGEVTVSMFMAAEPKIAHVLYTRSHACDGHSRGCVGFWLRIPRLWRVFNLQVLCACVPVPPPDLPRPSSHAHTSTSGSCDLNQLSI
jgi:hypothetical protein